MFSTRTLALLGAATLALTCCAGTPSTPQVASAKHPKCETFTGSLLCSSADDQGIVGPNTLNDSSPSVNAPAAARIGGH